PPRPPPRRVPRSVRARPRRAPQERRGQTAGDVRGPDGRPRRNRPRGIPPYGPRPGGGRRARPRPRRRPPAGNAPGRSPPPRGRNHGRNADGRGGREDKRVGSLYFRPSSFGLPLFLALDIGNSHVKAGLHDGAAWARIERFPTAAIEAGRLGAFVEEAEVEGAGLASVVPSATEPLATAVRHLTGRAPVVVHAGMALPFR